MNAAFEYTVNTGNPDLDRQTLDAYRQSAASSGMALEVQPLPTGGYHVRMSHPSMAPQGNPAYAPQQAYAQQQAQAQQQQQWQQQQYAQQAQQAQAAQWQQQPPSPQGYGQPQQAWQQQAPQQQASAPPQQAQGGWQQQQQMAFAGAGGAAGGGLVGAQDRAPALSQERLKYLRKVYTLLTATVFIAIASGFVVLNVGGTVKFAVEDHKGVTVQVPQIVATMLDNPGLMFGSFAVLFALTFVAGWTSKVKGLNVVMLFLVGAVMGLELAPMVFVAQVFAGLGDTLSANPVRDSFMMVGAVFAGLTGYIAVTKKDFSYLKGMLVMGTMVVFVACLLTFVFHTEMFALAVASVGALLSIGWLLYQTSWIFRKSKMDDPVGDALVFVVQLRNLFMFLLRILMSSRR